MTMLKNYITIAWRSLWKNKAFSAINIFGLAIGLSLAGLIAGYVWTELQVNKNLRNPDRQYILQSKWKEPNMGIETTTIGALPKALKDEYPNLIANYFRWDGIGSNVSNGNKIFRENLQISDSTMLDMYGFKLLSGDEKTALTQPFSIVITSAIAKKYFGKTDVVGQSLRIESFSGTRQDFVISGVLETPARNSVTFLNDNNDNQIYISAASASFFDREVDRWDNLFIAGYIELREGIMPSDLEKPIKQLIRQNASPEVAGNLTVEVVQLEDYYLNGTIKKMLYTLTYVAIFILLMAIINFVNISVSRSPSRQREIGVRKVLGGIRRELIFQFLIESLILTAFATCLSLLLYQVFRGYVPAILGKQIPGLSEYPIHFFLFLIPVVTAVGLIAGAYPAFFLSSFNPVNSLKGVVKTGTKNAHFRKALVCFQFCIALGVLISSLVISRQIALFFSRDIGYNKDSVISAAVPRDWSEKGVKHMKTIRDQFMQLAEVEQVSLSYQMPNGNYGANTNIYINNYKQSVGSLLLVTDENYASTYGLSLLGGTFLPDVKNDADLRKVVINESEMKALGWQNASQAIGKQLKLDGYEGSFAIAGVVKDFHFGSMQDEIPPLAFVNVGLITSYRFLSFKVKAGSTDRSIAKLQKLWTELLPGSAFEYSFMDDELKKIYKTELQLKKASFAATSLCTVIVILGILSLISSSIQTRTKEMGIRKVLGAPVSSLILIFVKEFLVVMLIASLIAGPATFLLMQNWLNSYAYRIELTGQPFILSITAMILTTVSLIIIQSIKSAITNPVKSLRTE